MQLGLLAVITAAVGYPFFVDASGKGSPDETSNAMALGPPQSDRSQAQLQTLTLMLNAIFAAFRCPGMDKQLEKRRNARDFKKKRQAVKLKMGANLEQVLLANAQMMNPPMTPLTPTVPKTPTSAAAPPLTPGSRSSVSQWPVPESPNLVAPRTVKEINQLKLNSNAPNAILARIMAGAPNAADVLRRSRGVDPQTMRQLLNNAQAYADSELDGLPTPGKRAAPPKRRRSSAFQPAGATVQQPAAAPQKLQTAFELKRMESTSTIASLRRMADSRTTDDPFINNNEVTLKILAPDEDDPSREVKSALSVSHLIISAADIGAGDRNFVACKTVFIFAYFIETSFCVLSQNVSTTEDSKLRRQSLMFFFQLEMLKTKWLKYCFDFEQRAAEFRGFKSEFGEVFDLLLTAVPDISETERAEIVRYADAGHVATAPTADEIRGIPVGPTNPTVAAAPLTSIQRRPSPTGFKASRIPTVAHRNATDDGSETETEATARPVGLPSGPPNRLIDQFLQRLKHRQSGELSSAAESMDEHSEDEFTPSIVPEPLFSPKPETQSWGKNGSPSSDVNLTDSYTRQSATPLYHRTKPSIQLARPPNKRKITNSSIVSAVSSTVSPSTSQEPSVHSNAEAVRRLTPGDGEITPRATDSRLSRKPSVISSVSTDYRDMSRPNQSAASSRRSETPTGRATNVSNVSLAPSYHRSKHSVMEEPSDSESNSSSAFDEYDSMTPPAAGRRQYNHSNMNVRPSEAVSSDYPPFQSGKISTERSTNDSSSDVSTQITRRASRPRRWERESVESDLEFQDQMSVSQSAGRSTVGQSQIQPNYSYPDRGSARDPTERWVDSHNVSGQGQSSYTHWEADDAESFVSPVVERRQKTYPTTPYSKPQNKSPKVGQVSPQIDGHSGFSVTTDYGKSSNQHSTPKSKGIEQFSRPIPGRRGGPLEHNRPPVQYPGHGPIQNHRRASPALPPYSASDDRTVTPPTPDYRPRGKHSKAAAPITYRNPRQIQPVGRGLSKLLDDMTTDVSLGQSEAADESNYDNHGSLSSHQNQVTTTGSKKERSPRRKSRSKKKISAPENSQHTEYSGLGVSGVRTSASYSHMDDTSSSTVTSIPVESVKSSAARQLQSSPTRQSTIVYGSKVKNTLKQRQSIVADSNTTEKQRKTKTPPVSIASSDGPASRGSPADSKLRRTAVENRNEKALLPPELASRKSSKSSRTSNRTNLTTTQRVRRRLKAADEGDSRTSRPSQRSENEWTDESPQASKLTVAESAPKPIRKRTGKSRNTASDVREVLKATEIIPTRKSSLQFSHWRSQGSADRAYSEMDDEDTIMPEDALSYVSRANSLSTRPDDMKSIASIGTTVRARDGSAERIEARRNKDRSRDHRTSRDHHKSNHRKDRKKSKKSSKGSKGSKSKKTPPQPERRDSVPYYVREYDTEDKRKNSLTQNVKNIIRHISGKTIDDDDDYDYGKSTYL